MALTAEITELTVKDSGEKFKGQKHNISAKLTLKDGVAIIHEQTFSESHKNIYSITDTMEKIRAKMSAVKSQVEKELLLKIEAEKEVAGMLTKI